MEFFSEKTVYWSGEMVDMVLKFGHRLNEFRMDRHLSDRITVCRDCRPILEHTT